MAAFSIRAGRPNPTTAIILALFLIPLSPRIPNAIAQTSGAMGLLISPSVRSDGMGRAGAAVFWGSETDYWSNPALLGYAQGFRIEHSRTQLVPDLASDVFFTTNRLTFGLWGLGISLAGRPADIGGLRLDYGASVATDENGVELGTFNSYEKIRSISVGLSVATLIDSVSRRAQLRMIPISRFGDLAIGRSSKNDFVMLVPAEFTLSGQEGSGEVNASDIGLLLRLTPINSIDPPVLPELDTVLKRVGGIRLDWSYGLSAQNTGHDRISFIDQDQSDPITEVRRSGTAVRLVLGFPPSARQALQKAGLGWVPSALTPLVSLGKTSQDAQPTWPWRERAIEESGWEVTIANVLSIRRGRIDDPDGEIHGDTRGTSVGFHIDRLFGFSIDRATVPQAVGLARVRKKGFSFYIDPIGIWKTTSAR